MKSKRYFNIKRQVGVTLIEVMLSMALGIFFLGVAVEYLVTGQQSAGVQDVGSRVQENARFAFNVLQEDIRHAGYNGDPSNTANRFIPSIYLDNCDLVPNPCTVDDVADFGDRIAIGYVADTAMNTDCIGTAIPTDGTQMANVYWVEQNGDVNSLYCNGWDINAGDWNNDGTEQPILDGIDHMQVQYGIVTETGRTRFLSAAAMTTADAWGDVRSVRLALLVDSGLQTDAAGRAGNQAFIADGTITYTLLDQTSDQDDGRIRRVYTTTVELNNSFD